jgi:hypothetical protein
LKREGERRGLKENGGVNVFKVQSAHLRFSQCNSLVLKI